MLKELLLTLWINENAELFYDSKDLQGYKHEESASFDDSLSMN